MAKHEHKRREFIISAGILGSGVLSGLLSKAVVANEPGHELSAGIVPTETSKGCAAAGKDRWRGRVKTILGKPVAMVDISITRTIMIDAQVYDRFDHLLRTGVMNGEPRAMDEPSGLAEVANFYKLVEALPANAHSYVVVPWTEAEGSRISMESLHVLVKYFDATAYWRIEGAPETGLFLIFNLGAQDHRFEMNNTTIPQFDAMLQMQKAATEAAVQNRQLTGEQKREIDAVCERAGVLSKACKDMLDAHARRQREVEERERKRLQKEQSDKLREHNTKAERVTGDFPRGWGGAFRNIA